MYPESTEERKNENAPKKNKVVAGTDEDLCDVMDNQEEEKVDFDHQQSQPGADKKAIMIGTTTFIGTVLHLRIENFL